MHPADCPPWEYANHPQKRSILPARHRQVLIELRTNQLDTRESASDSRSVHLRLFRELTPPGYEYYAGHYRGEGFRCLQYYPVRVRSDPRVGYAPQLVLGVMEETRKLIDAGVRALDVASEIPNAQLPPEQKLVNTVVFVCHVFELFLRIHPYANGNGHAARFIVWAMLGRYGYWPRNWPIEPRPPDPPYTDLIRQYRDGDKEPLERFILRTIVG